LNERLGGLQYARHARTPITWRFTDGDESEDHRELCGDLGLAPELREVFRATLNGLGGREKAVEYLLGDYVFMLYELSLVLEITN